MHRFQIPLAALAAVAFAGTTSTSTAACVDQINASSQDSIILAQTASPGSQRHPAPPAVQAPKTEGGSKAPSSDGGGGTDGSSTSGSGAGAGTGDNDAGGASGGSAGSGGGAGAGGSGAGGGGSGGGGDN